MTRVPKNASVQQIAKNVLAAIADSISSESSERTIAVNAVKLLAEQGVTQTWYHDCPALVLLGSRSCLSISGRDYQPADERVGETNLVTIDLSPLSDGHWGDCARSFVIENGRVVSNATLPEFQRGLTAVENLHNEMRGWVSPTTRFCDLYRFANESIDENGFENLDFLQNVGHSVETCLADRKFINGDTTQTLGSVTCFTFEPHICEPNRKWGFKHEEIYYFDGEGKARVL